MIYCYYAAALYHPLPPDALFPAGISSSLRTLPRKNHSILANHYNMTGRHYISSVLKYYPMPETKEYLCICAFVCILVGMCIEMVDIAAKPARKTSL